VTVGVVGSADVRAEDVRLDDLGRPSFTLITPAGRAPVALPLVGGHHVGNALAATAAALECGMPLADVAEGLATARPASRWRMEVSERSDGVVVINDAYNANPESMRAALSALAAVAGARRSAGGRSFAVLGPMAELGPDEVAEHENLGRTVARSGVSRIVAVGEPARPIERSAALEGSWDGEASWVPDVEGAVALLREELRPGDVVLVKASRAASLERVALRIADDTVAGPDDGSGPTSGNGGAA
jgi:UDP-N-acetylmuramoyl-tripeptide--D-alanyl-D-alanine ligase